MTANIPKAFISYSSADKETAEHLAKDLISQGVDAWFDKWEIMPGNSLRRKIEQGISEASHFIVLLTENSLKSEWVQTELDAAMVRKIENECRLLPVLYGIPFEDVPLTLRGLLCVNLYDYREGLDQLVDACYGRSRKPPLGQSEQKIIMKTLPLSSNAQLIARLLNSNSEVGMSYDPILSLDEITKALSLTEDLAEEAIDELKDEGFVGVILTINAPLRVFPHNRLFWETDSVCKRWTPSDDARILSSILVNGDQDGANLSEMDKKLNWGPRRINPAATYLVEHDMVQASKAIGTHPYAYAWLRATSKTRRFLRNL
ncbi:MAG: hypothetical protein A2Z59_03675 [Nitrospinae bacterium RIFCSPLOWO2_02_39_17]|nr:MAG: hypothetical protein A2Z59_03675 [Nitrospinae bacterium RIFCSPLOWO2_02_39_17]OGW08331.1 MAG: hypothetical protein A2W75_00605 [Nitrospinae bacterium RIFCSPLOWO2_12_39_15]OGW08825.1 MAG: hypothetical protein A3F81_02155 [Nitrospinae bacterium RIFCSPLOWO2_12_FULL_39_93]